MRACLGAMIDIVCCLLQSDRGHFGGWQQHVLMATGPDGNITHIEVKSPDQADSSGAEEAGGKQMSARMSRAHRVPTKVVEPIPPDYLFREKWRPWLSRQVRTQTMSQAACSTGLVQGS